jgi:uncharacterized protein YuzE
VVSLKLDTTYDADTDAAYIAFDNVADGEAVRQIVVGDKRLGRFNVILDVDEHDKLLGIELLDVSAIVARPRFEDGPR